MNPAPVVKEEVLRTVISEAIGALRMLDSIAMQLVIHGSSHDIKLEEIITDIRVIKGVATVTQDSAIRYLPTGRRVAEMIISFDPKDLKNIDYVDMLSKTIKKHKAIDRIILKTMNGRPLRDDSGRRIIY